MEIEEGVPLTASRQKGGRRWRRVVERRLPATAWARRYDRTTAVADAVAGLTLGLTLVPQSIAYAALADLPVQVGLYTSFVGAILYTFLGTVKEVSIGPTSLMALLTLQTCRGLGLPYVVLLTFLSGAVVMLMGLLRLGFIVDLISPSVTSGFTSATAVIIVVSQVKGVLGLSFSADSVLDNLRQLFARAHLLRTNDCVLAALCCVTLLALRKVKDIPVRGAWVRKSLWLLCISRNALVVLAASTFAFCTHRPDTEPFVLLSGRVKPGLPSISLPAFSVVEGNVTVPLTVMVRRLGPSVLLLPMVMVVANIAIAKAFTREGRVEASQEMVTLGACNIAGACVGAMPACGAFTRSAVAHSSGVRTPAASLYTGIVTVMALAFLTEYFYFIPKACLSSVLICAVIFMIDVHTVAVLWRRDRRELVVVGSTLAVSVAATVELGVLAGVSAALALLMYELVGPCSSTDDTLLLVKTEVGEAVVWRARRALVFLNVERVCACVLHTLARTHAHTHTLLLDCSGLAIIDAHAVQVLERLSRKLSAAGGALVPYSARGAVLQRLATAELQHGALRVSSAAAAAAALQPAVADAAPPLPDRADATDDACPV